jgi:hypothetical protein
MTSFLNDPLRSILLSFTHLHNTVHKSVPDYALAQLLQSFLYFMRTIATFLLLHNLPLNYVHIYAIDNQVKNIYLPENQFLE